MAYHDEDDEREEFSIGTMFTTAWYMLPMTLFFLLVRSALVVVLLPRADVWGEMFVNILFWGLQGLVAALVTGFFFWRKQWGIALASLASFLLPFARGLFT